MKGDADQILTEALLQIRFIAHGQAYLHREETKHIYSVSDSALQRAGTYRRAPKTYPDKRKRLRDP